MRRSLPIVLPALLLGLAGAAPADTAEQDALKADERAAILRRDADAADAKARGARQQAIDLARRIQEGEARISGIEADMKRVAELQRQQRARLASQQGEISRLLAMLQTLSRRPAGLVLLEPGTAVTTARVSALLDALQPALKARTAAFRSELARSRAMRGRLDDARRQHLAANAELAGSISALDAVQADLRRARDDLDRKADMERARVRDLAAQAMDLRGLAVAFDRSRGQARPRPLAHPRAGAARLPFAYQAPATGGVVLAFGEPNAAGVRARGLTLATRDGAQVVAPGEGRIAYSGPFRTYGNIVIVEHPSGLLSMMSGLERVDVLVGETVRAGMPVGRMGSLEPRLYLELRRDGRPLDPAPYVAQRVRDG